jgi:hypothetical protein
MEIEVKAQMTINKNLKGKCLKYLLFLLNFLFIFLYIHISDLKNEINENLFAIYK